MPQETFVSIPPHVNSAADFTKHCVKSKHLLEIVFPVLTVCLALPGFDSVLSVFYPMYFSGQPINKYHGYFNFADAQAEA